MSIVFAPPGSGKTFWLGSTQNVNCKWQDVDIMCFHYGLHDSTFHQGAHTLEQIEAHYKEIDRALSEWKKRGFYVLGSLFWAYRPDQKRVQMRKDLHWTRVNSIRDYLRQLAETHDIPVYASFEAGLNDL